MYLLNRAEYRLNAYLANFSEMSDQFKEINARYQRPYITDAGPLSLSDVPVAADISGIDPSIKKVTNAIQRQRAGSLNQGEGAAARSNLERVVQQELQDRQLPGDKSYLDNQIRNTRAIEEITRNDPARIVNGELLPIVEDIPSDSPISRRLQERAVQEKASKNRAAIREGRLTPGSPEDIQRQQTKRLLEINALELQKKQDAISTPLTTARPKVARAKTSLSNAVTGAVSNIVDAKAASNTDPSVKVRAVLPATTDKKGRRLISSDRRAAYDALIEKDAAGNVIRRPGSQEVREWLANKGVVVPSPQEVQTNLGRAVDEGRTGRGIQIPDKGGNLLQQKVRAVKKAQSVSAPLSKQSKSNERKLKGIGRQLSRLSTPESWADQITVPTPDIPVPSYAIRDTDGKLVTDQVRLKPSRGGGLGRRLDNLTNIDNVVKSSEIVDGRVILPSNALNMVAEGSPPKAPIPTVSPPASVKIPVAKPVAPPAVTTTKAPTLLQTLKQQAGKAGKKAGQIKANVRQRNARVQAGKAARTSLGPSPASPGYVPPSTSSASPATPPPATATPGTGSSKDKFKAKATTPKGVYEAEVEVPSWFRPGKEAKAAKAATGTPKPVKIANTIRDGNLLGNVKDYYKNLSGSTKKALLGGGLAVGGLGLLAAGSNRAAQDRAAQESRARELATVASRPPALPENQLPYNPYDYQGYPY